MIAHGMCFYRSRYNWCYKQYQILFEAVPHYGFHHSRSKFHFPNFNYCAQKVSSKWQTVVCAAVNVLLIYLLSCVLWVNINFKIVNNKCVVCSVCDWLMSLLYYVLKDRRCNTAWRWNTYSISQNYGSLCRYAIFLNKNSARKVAI